MSEPVQINPERARQLADVIERSKTYRQDQYENECGTPACICGHANAQQGTEPTDVLKAAAWLGLREYGWGERSGNLFRSLPADSWQAPFDSRWRKADAIDDATARRRAQRQIAADYLRHLADEWERRTEGKGT